MRFPSLRHGPLALCAAAFAFLLSACEATESHRKVEKETVATFRTDYAGPRYSLAIGKFENTSPYMRGMFSVGADLLGGQAKTILKTHLSQANRFDVVDRDNMTEIENESTISGEKQELSGAEVVVTGQVTEFGRRNSGDQALFGILGNSKKQRAYSVVSLNVVDVRTSKVVYSVQGAGEYDLEDREVLGTGSSAGYDSTLNGKVLNLSITDAVEKLVVGLERGEWSPSKAKK
jgi:curli biogenesis system outer membrane secretion channel CsgG